MCGEGGDFGLICIFAFWNLDIYNLAINIFTYKLLLSYTIIIMIICMVYEIAIIIVDEH